MFLHKRGNDEMVVTEHPTDPRDGRSPYYINESLAYLDICAFPKSVAEKLEKALPLRFVVPEHAGDHVGLWICSVELPKLAREGGRA